jgi:C-terminal processing protease CtpA/Prc
MKLSRVMAGVAAGAMLFLGAAQNGVAGMSSEQRLNDYSQLVNIVQRHYGPLIWKKTSINLDFARLVEEFRGKVLSVQSDAEFYRILSQFLANLHDAHVSPMIPSNYKATLGFTADLVEGKALIDSVDTLRLPSLLFPFKKGDQIISIGGVAVDKIASELALVSNTGSEASTKRIAYARLGTRKEAAGLAVPKGITTITVLPKGADKPVTVTATWILTGTPLVELDDLAGQLSSSNVSTVATAADGEDLIHELKKLSIFKMQLPQSFIDDLTRTGMADMGAAKSMFKLPANATVYEDISVTAAVYEVAGKKIGVLRIPSYTEEGLTEVLARALLRMEKETDVLVLDQTNNPGGSVSQVSDIVSLFADKSYKDMDFEIRPSLAWLQSFQEINQQISDMLGKNPEDMAANALKARFEYLESEIRDSLVQKRFHTNPVSLNLTGTFGMIQPAGAVHYSKPVLLLINELDFSGGDAFPAIMKDNGRVTTFGTATTGAGGNVREYGPLANSFFKLHLTESLMVRPNGQYMENRGVKADVEYSFTEDDFMNGYRGYVQNFTNAALKLTGMTQEQIDAALAEKK